MHSDVFFTLESMHFTAPKIRLRNIFDIGHSRGWMFFFLFFFLLLISPNSVILPLPLPLPPHLPAFLLFFLKKKHFISNITNKHIHKPYVCSR